MLESAHASVTPLAMIWVDYCILAVFVLSTLIGILRGFARESLGLATWVLAFFLAWLFGADLAMTLDDKILNPALRLATGYALVFLGTLLTGSIVTYFVGEAIRASGFGPTDRTLGGGLGLVRGVVIVAAFILVARTMGAEKDRWWQDSLLVKRFEWLADGLKTLVPDAWLERLAPEPTPTSPPSP